MLIECLDCERRQSTGNKSARERIQQAERVPRRCIGYALVVDNRYVQPLAGQIVGGGASCDSSAYDGGVYSVSLCAPDRGLGCAALAAPI